MTQRSGGKNFGFPQKEASGRSGGIISIWDVGVFTAIEAVGDENYIAIKGNWKGMCNDVVVVNIYGPHSEVQKKNMWDKLMQLISSITAAWVVCGDFNEVRVQDDRFNCNFNQRGADAFNEFIDRVGLVEIPLVGRKYTRVSDDGLKFGKLDRFLVTMEFKQYYKDLLVIPLDRKRSDHCPIMLRDKIIDYGPKPFRVYDEWLQDVEMESVVKRGWEMPAKSRRPSIYRDRMKNVRATIREWSRKKFGWEECKP